MGLVTRQHESGLLVAEESAGGWAGLRRALKEFDRSLVLWPPDAMSPYWRVLRKVSDDRPAIEVLTWMDDDGTPRQLSSGILEAVRRLHREARNTGPTADERNAAHEARVKKERQENLEALKDEYRPYLDHGRVGVSMGPKPRKPYWQRKWGGGEL